MNGSSWYLMTALIHRVETGNATLEGGGEARLGCRSAGRRTTVIVRSGEQEDLEIAGFGEPGIDQAGSRTQPSQDSGKPDAHLLNLRERVWLFKPERGGLRKNRREEIFDPGATSWSGGGTHESTERWR